MEKNLKKNFSKFFWVSHYVIMTSFIFHFDSLYKFLTSFPIDRHPYCPCYGNFRQTGSDHGTGSDVKSHDFESQNTLRPISVQNKCLHRKTQGFYTWIMKYNMFLCDVIMRLWRHRHDQFWPEMSSVELHGHFDTHKGLINCS